MEFIKKFLGISQTESYIFFAFLLLTITILILVRVFTKKIMLKKYPKWAEYGWNFSLYLGIIFALILGLIFASLNNFKAINPSDQSNLNQALIEVYNLASIFANLFVSAITLIIAPIIFFAIGSKIATITHNKSVLITIGYLLFGVVLGIAFAAGFAQLFRVLPTLNGFLGQVNRISIPTTESILSTIASWVPRNLLAANNFGSITIGVVIVALLIGFAVLFFKKQHPQSRRAEFSINFLNSGYKIFNIVLDFILELFPIGVLGLLIRSLLRNGINVIVQVSWFFLIFIIALLLLVLFQLLLVWWKAGINPYQYAKKAYKPWLAAFLTQSSNATLPITQKTLNENFGVQKSIAEITPALGTTIGMVACGALYPAMAASFVAIMDNGFFVANNEANFWLFLIVGTFFASFGLSGSPGVASVSTRAVFAVTNLDYAKTIGPILAIDPLIDMFRTWANVNGAMVAAILSDVKNKKIKKHQLEINKKSITF